MGSQLFALQTRGSPYRFVGGFHEVTKVSCGLRFTLWNYILRSRCSLKDDKVKSADGGEVRVIEFLSDIRPILLIHSQFTK